MVLGSFWYRFGIVLGSVRDRLGCVGAVFGHVLRMFWYGFGILFERVGLFPIAPEDLLSESN